MAEAFRAGKLPPELFRALLDRLPGGDPRVAVGPRYGEDAAVIEFGDRYLVAKSDPVTFTEERIGWYAVHVNANDIACMGAEPRWFLPTVLLPEGRADAALVGAIFEDIGRACRGLGVTVVGGHTEVTPSLPRPIVAGQMLGEVERGRLVRGDLARPGDEILLTKNIPIEGSSILARLREEELKKTLGPEIVLRARALLDEPGISVVREALIASRAGKVHAMHDPTEGGLANGLHELAAAAGTGAVVLAEEVPLLPEGEAICRSLGLDPLGVIASGSLLIALPPASTPAVLSALAAAGIPCRKVGRLMPREFGVCLREGTAERPLPFFLSDELTRAL